MKITKTLLLSAFFALAACDGPWNMGPDDSPAPKPQELWVSGFLVAERSFDTLWFERPVPLTVKRDTGNPFVDQAASRVRVIRTDSADTVDYRLASGKTTAWVPVDPAARVARGGRYRLEAVVRWSEYRGQVHVDTIMASTYVPRTYALSDSILAPLEALHPSLAAGLPREVISKLQADVGYAIALWDSLNQIRSLARYNLTLADVETYLRGGEVYRPIRQDDTVFYISDLTPSLDASGQWTARYTRQFKFPQTIDRAHWGGIIVSLGNDSTGAYIDAPLQQMIRASTGQDLDTSRLYNGEDPFVYEVMPRFIPDLLGYPDTVYVSNWFHMRTGRNTWRTYAVDSLYVEYNRGLTNDANNALRYSNVRGGNGYFAGATPDSFSLHVVATKDTVNYEAIRRAWCQDKHDDHLEDVQGDTLRFPWKVPPICVGRMPTPDSDE